MSKALTQVDKQLAEEAANIAATISAPSSNKIKLTDKVFKLPDGQVLQAPLQVVIVDYLSRNTYYDVPYNANNPVDPVCWAINKNPSDLAPDPSQVAGPFNDTCQGCPYDEFGSHPQTDGKACINRRILAVLLPTLSDEKMYTIETSPTAIGAFDAFVGVVAKLYASTPIKVITELTFHPEKNYPSLMFGNPQPNPDYKEHFARREEAMTLLQIPPISGNTSEPAAKKKAPARRKRRT